jgi:protein-L-isoaspartate(D-aspartate) O-methyltransferase
VTRLSAAAFISAAIAACTQGGATAGQQESSQRDAFPIARERMVMEHLAGRDIDDARVLRAMRDVPRHLFVPPALQKQAYDDRPLPIGHDQTISQPYIVALMTQLARPKPGDQALEVGTGSGYQAAVLSQVVAHVYSIELIEELARDATARLQQLGYKNITTRAGDGYAGWPEAAPFDVVLVTAAPDHVPQPLVDQLKPGGRMVIPVGSVFETQQLQLIEKNGEGRVSTRTIVPVRFVPLRRR